MEITFVTSESGKTKYWGVLDGVTFLQTGTKKAAVSLLNYLSEKNGLQPNLYNNVSSEQVDSSPTSNTSENSDRIRANDFDRCDNSEEEQEDPELRAFLDASARADEAMENVIVQIREIASDYSRLVDATAKASLLGSSNGTRLLDPETIDVSVIK